jgi:hypothetical protein
MISLNWNSAIILKSWKNHRDLEVFSKKFGLGSEWKENPSDNLKRIRLKHLVRLEVKYILSYFKNGNDHLFPVCIGGFQLLFYLVKNCW